MIVICHRQYVYLKSLSTPHAHSTNAKTAAPIIVMAALILLAPPVTCAGAVVVVLPGAGLEVG